MEVPVLIVGAGPTGLVLALWLTQFGIRVRIIDQSSKSGETSRAIAVQARTLEYYQQIGLANDVVAGGIKVAVGNVRKNNHTIAKLPFADMGKGLSPFPFVLSFPQDDHEKVLIAHLERLGVKVERNTELVGFNQDKDFVTATLKSGEKTETVKAAYLCGCDGARSTVRTTLGIGFPGGTYNHIFYVADVSATTAVDIDNLQMCLSKHGFTLVVAVRSSGSFRLIGLVPPECDKKDITQIKFDDVAATVARDTDVKISKVNWFSTYHVHHRVADHFRVERVFLLGDAGHIHSPAGGQGMNTGISDAVNLAWKLAAVLQCRAANSILDSYEIERIAFARKLVSTTDKLFQLMTDSGGIGYVWRNIFLPVVAPILFKFHLVTRGFFKMISQIEIKYRESPLSQGVAGKIHAGDRLPWVMYDSKDNFKCLESLDWQAHVYGAATPGLKIALGLAKVSLHEFVWNDKTNAAGLLKDALYLVRPDGYVGMAESEQNVEKLQQYLTHHGIVTR